MTEFKAITTLLLLGAAMADASAAPGDLDATFGTDGLATVGSGEFTAVQGITIQPDGMIIGATNSSNSLAVFRLQANGSADTTFGSGGIAVVTGSGTALDVVVDSNDRIYVAFSTGDTNYNVARLLPDGTLDTGFGGDGLVAIDVGILLGGSGTADRVRGMTLLPDGKLLLIGNYWSGQLDNQDVGLVRLNSDGTPDTSFGNGGASPVRLLNLRPVWGLEASLQADGKIVFIADENTTGSKNLWLLRYLANGSDIDESFGELGLAQIDIDGTFGDNSGRTTATDMIVQPDGKILVAGRVGSFAVDTFVARFSADGVLDPTFSGDGYVILQIDDALNRGATELVLQPDGKILVSDLSGITRFTATGEIDMTFSADGIASSGSPIASREADTMALDADGKIVTGGTTFDSSTSDTDPMIARYDGDDFDLTPDAFMFTDNPGATAGEITTSDAITIGGLSAGASVPVMVEGGEYAVGGSANYLTALSYATIGTQLSVRHIAGSSEGESVDTTLRVGGLNSHNNLMVAIGARASDTYTSTVGTAGGSDGDGDGVPDDEDNAPGEPNPDQSDIDADGVGDVADVCPADTTDQCNTQRSAAESIGSAGGTVLVPDGAVSVNVPAGALASDTSISVTDLGTGFTVATDLGDTTAIIAVKIGPDGTNFSAPIEVRFAWVDADNDGVVDGTADAEADLRIFKDGVAITNVCSNEAGCNTNANTFLVQVTSLSDFVLGTIASGGGGGVEPPPPPPRRSSGGGALGIPVLLAMLTMVVIRRRGRQAPSSCVVG